MIWFYNVRNKAKRYGSQRIQWCVINFSTKVRKTCFLCTQRLREYSLVIWERRVAGVFKLFCVQVCTYAFPPARPPACIAMRVRGCARAFSSPVTVVDLGTEPGEGCEGIGEIALFVNPAPPVCHERAISVNDA